MEKKYLNFSKTSNYAYALQRVKENNTCTNFRC
jgi:hypothetical protein